MRWDWDSSVADEIRVRLRVRTTDWRRFKATAIDGRDTVEHGGERSLDSDLAPSRLVAADATH